MELADINNTICLWEVKPLSYAYEPNKTIGKKQLQNYIDSKPGEYIHGGSYIQDGQTSLSKTLVRAEGEVETVTYIIDYYNAQDGMIYYQFERNVKKEQKQENEETVTVTEEEKSSSVMPARVRVVSEILDQIPQPTSAEDAESKRKRDVGTIIAAAGVAAFIYAVNKALFKSKVTSVSVSAIETCAKFLSKATPVIACEEEGGEQDQETIDEAISALDDLMTFLEAIGYDELVKELEIAMYEGDQEKIDELLKKIQEESGIYDEAGEAQPPRDPLVIDLGESGIVLHSIENGVNFDLDNNGFEERTAWIGTEDGFLALDRNENGKIDNGGELFGDQVTLENGSISSSGFEALAELDENEDGKINSKDSAYEELLVWIDADHNGISKAGELKKLSELDIVSISLEHTEKSIVDEETGTRIAETADVKIQQNLGKKTVEISEFWFPVNSSETTQGGKVTAGHVPALEQAIVDDETGQLYQLLYDFSESDDISQKRCYLKQILYFITESDEIVANSRGGNIDARDLHVIEQFMGREFSGVDGSNPNVNAAAILQGIYANIEEYYYNILNMYSGLGGYLLTVQEDEDDDGNKSMDLTLLNHIIGLKMSKGENVDSIVYDLGVYLKSYDKINSTSYFNEYSKHYSSISTRYSNIVGLTKSSNTYIGMAQDDFYGGTNYADFIFGKEWADTLNGGNGNDSINGNAGNDTISGGSGEDILNGEEGDDVLDGGAGNDFLNDNGGNDKYVFTKGYGIDTISDNGGKNTLCFTGITSDSILVNGTEKNDVTITIKGTADKLIIKDFCKSEELADYTLEFKDKTIHCLEAESPFRHVCGTDSEEKLKAVVTDSVMNAFGGDDTVVGSAGVDVIYGNEGNDIITAGDGKDTVYGGADDDSISGEDGDDILYGEAGQDILDGGSGNDSIMDSEGENIIIFGDEILSGQIKAYRQNWNDLLITFENMTDTLTIKNYCINEKARGFKLIFADGVLTAAADKNSPLRKINDKVGTEYIPSIYEDGVIIVSTDGDDQLEGSEHADTLIGSDGNNRIIGKGGDDTLEGGKGKDYLDGGAGSDIQEMIFINSVQEMELTP